jgi:hypothetical protein
MEMRRLKTAGVILTAVYAICVLTAAAASANSTVLPEFSTTSSSTGTGGEASLSLEGTTLSCENNRDETTATSKKLGTFRILFGGCKAGGKACHSLGQAAGSETEELTGEYHLVSLGSNRTHYLIWFLLGASTNTGALHLECESAAIGLLLLWGNFLGLIEEKSGTTYKINIESVGGGATLKQAVVTYGNNSGEEITVLGLRGRLTNTGTERKGTEKTEALLAFATGTTILES